MYRLPTCLARVKARSPVKGLLINKFHKRMRKGIEDILTTVCASHFVQTAILCVPAGVFSCPLVVTMRPIPAGMLDAVVEETHLNPLAHGAPVHIGDPGINDTRTSHRIVMIYY